MNATQINLAKTKESLNIIKAEINGWRNQLDSFETNRDMWRLVNEQTKKRTTEINESIKSFREELFLSKLHSFKKRQLLFVEEVTRWNRYRQAFLSLPEMMSCLISFSIFKNSQFKRGKSQHSERRHVKITEKQSPVHQWSRVSS